MKSVVVITAVLCLLFQDSWSLQTQLAKQLAYKGSSCSLAILEKPHFSVPQQILLQAFHVYEREITFVWDALGIQELATN